MLIHEVLLLLSVKRHRITDLAKLCSFWLDVLLGNLSLHPIFNPRVDWAFRVEVALLSVMLGVTLGVDLHRSITSRVEQFTVVLGDIHLRLHILKRAGTLNELTLWFTHPRRRSGDHIVLSLRLVNIVLALVLYIMLPKHRISSLPWRQLLHPLLIFALHVSVVVDLPKGRPLRQLRCVCNVILRLRFFGDFDLLLLLIKLIGLFGIFFLLNGLIVFHLALKISEVFPGDIGCWSLLLSLDLVELIKKELVSFTALRQPLLNLQHKRLLLCLKVFYLVAQILRLLAVVLHILLKIVLLLVTLLLHADPLSLDALLLEPYLLLFLLHLLGELLEHCYLPPGFIVHQGGRSHAALPTRNVGQ